MCGFVGQLSFNNSSLNNETLEQLNHRGPDDTNYYLHKEKNYIIHFGHKRLNILDIEFGKQPMLSNNQDIVIIFNGEIYNFDELRSKLISLGFTFKSKNSDTEVILNAYLKWGTNLTNYLNGMWAFTIYDKKNNIIFLSRDRFGEKPLYYYQSKDNFSFASETQSIVNLNKNILIDNNSLIKYCALGFLPGKLTPYKNLFQIEAGTNLIFKIHSKEIIISRYWEYKIEPDYKKSESQLVDELYSLLDESTKKRMVADTEVGILLSGGLDSSVISYFANKHSSNRLKTFSINFNETDFDESNYALNISKKFNTEHYPILFNNNSGSHIQKSINKCNDLISDSSILSFYLLCQNTSKKVKVAIGGDAADELFAGYDTFKALKLHDDYNGLFNSGKKIYPFLSFFSKLIPSNNYGYMNFKFKIDRFLKYNQKNLALANPVWLSPLQINQIEVLFDKKLSYEEIYSEIIEEWESNDNLSVFDKALEFYTKFFLQNQILTKTDRFSMLNSLEVRAPLLDYDFVECVRKIPNKLKLKNGINKYIFKKMAEKIFDKKFVYRKKIGFSSPISKMILNNQLDLKIKSKFLTKKEKFFSNLIKNHRNYKEENRLPIWNLINLDNFMTKYENNFYN